jgi:NADP-dependent 3-hydroxy acid dehydrogenase YdfG
MPVSLKDQRVLVLGASSGVGRASAILFAREGARVMAAARREERLRGLREELSREGHSIEVATADASSAASMEELAGRTGPVDILVYSSGTNIPDRAMTRLSVETWDMMFTVNCSGAFYITRALLPAMRERGSGHLIFVSSISGLLADVSGASYQAAKRGIVGLSHAIRVEEKEHGIRTCVVCPGLIDTELIEKRPVKTAPEIVAKALQAEDVAETILSVAKLPPRACIPEIQVMPTYL